MLDLREKQGDEHHCPLCRDTLGDSAVRCSSCDTGYHADCLNELGGCSTLGCAGPATEPAPDVVYGPIKIVTAQEHHEVERLYGDGSFGAMVIGVLLGMIVLVVLLNVIR